MATHYIDAVLRFRDQMTTKLDATSKKLEGMSQTMTRRGKTLVKAGRQMQSVGASLTKHLTLPIVGLGAASGAAFTKYQEAIAKVGTIASGQGVPLSRLSKQIMSLSNESGVAASDVAEQTYQAISAGQKAGDAVNFVSHAVKLSKAGFTDMASATDVLTTAMNSYGMKAKEVGKVSDMLIKTQNLGKTTVGELSSYMGKVIPIAGQNNVAFKDLSASYVALTKNGTKTAQATTQLKSMYNELGKSGSTVGKILQQETGKSFDELMKSGSSVGDVLKLLQKHADKTGTKFSDLWSNANSKSAAATLTKHAKDYNNALDSMGKSAGTTEKAFKRMEGTAAERMQKAKTRMQNAMIQFGAPVMEILAPILEKLGKMATKIQNWLASLPPAQQKVIVKILATVAAIGPLISLVGKGMETVGNVMKSTKKITGTMQGFSMVLGKIGPHGLIAVAVIAAIAAVTLILYKNWDKIGPVVKKAWNAFKKFGKKAGKVLSHLIKLLKSFIKLLKKIGGPLTKAVAKVVITRFKLMIALIKLWVRVVKVVAKVVIARFKLMIAPIKLLVRVVKSVVKAFKNLASTVSDKMAKLKDTVVGKVQAIKDGVKEKVQAIVDVFEGLPGKIWEKIKDIPSKIKDAFQLPDIKLPSWLNIGGNARGTKHWRGGLTQVNENGGEILNLPNGTQIIPNDISKRMADNAAKGMGANVTIPKLADTIVVREDADIDKLVDALYDRFSAIVENVPA